MTTSILYHTQRIADFQVLRTTSYRPEMTVEIIRRADRFQCPLCRSFHVAATPAGLRRIAAPPMGVSALLLIVWMHRLRCADCGAFRMETLPFLPAPKARITKAFAHLLLQLRAHTSISALAAWYGLHWTTVKDIEKQHLERQYRRVKLKNVRYIGIDEIHAGSRMGHKGFFTVVRDLQSGAVLEVARGKGASALNNFACRLKRSRCRIEAVAADLANGYTSWIRENLPDARIVYDHFHVVQLMNEKMQVLRRRTMNSLEECEKDALKQRRWHFIKGREKLDEKAENQLQRCMQEFQNLGIAWFLKETLRDIYATAFCADEARAAFQHWCELAEASGIRELGVIARTVRRHLEGIVAYWTTGLTTAGMEGFNSKIRWLNSQARGYQDERYFILKIFDLPNLDRRHEL